MLEKILEAAFRNARKETGQSEYSKNRFENAKRHEVDKVKKASEYLRDFLKREVREVPNIETLSKFQQETLGAELDVDALRKALGHLEKTAQLLKRLRFQSVHQLHGIRRREDYGQFAQETKKAYGKLASVVRKSESSFQTVVDAKRKLKELPKIDETSPVLLLSGFPNTGKSELLKRLTGSNVTIAQYAFTTQSINVGKVSIRRAELQIVDCPGLLDREKHNPVERKALSALAHLPGKVAFVVDPSETCGYRIAEQFSLFEKLRQQFSKKSFIVVYNKSDLYSKEQIGLAKALFQFSPFAETGKSDDQLKEWLEKNLGLF